ncbi:MAG: alanine racemase [Rhodocyclaceae bacterium]|jgi:alanine racemase|nr:alanine racemase [Rhodocyclaceae bacterium]
MRPARALIDLNALRHNYLHARALHGGRALAVVKANAYGHGAVPCAQALAPLVDGFAVGVLDEALQLREAGIGRPILLLEGVFDPTELAQARAQGLWMVVHHDAQLRMLETLPAQAGTPPMQVWLKINSGMNRAGFEPAEVATAWARLRACAQVGDITLISHLARADEPGADATPQQLATFDHATRALPGARSLCNSAGLLAWPEARRDWARPGIMLYGVDPLPADHAPASLRTVMHLESAIMAVREIPAGAPVGYGGRFRAGQPTRVGLVAMGYADGYPRTVPDGTPVRVAGQPSRIIGRVSMDMLTVDLTGLPDAGLGTPVELWGAQVSINDIAQAAGTIAYELLCNVKRVRFEYQGLETQGVEEWKPPGRHRPRRDGSNAQIAVPQPTVGTKLR